MIDLLEGMLGDASSNVTLNPAVRVAASLGQGVLNKYYQKTDESVMYRCAICTYIPLPLLLALTRYLCARSAPSAAQDRVLPKAAVAAILDRHSNQCASRGVEAVQACSTTSSSSWRHRTEGT